MSEVGFSQRMPRQKHLLGAHAFLQWVKTGQGLRTRPFLQEKLNGHISAGHSAERKAVRSGDAAACIPALYLSMQLLFRP
jgi:hypothetical protein